MGTVTRKGLRGLGVGIAAAALLAAGGAAAQPDERPGKGPMMGGGNPHALHGGQVMMLQHLPPGLGYGSGWGWMRGGFEGGFGDPMSPLWDLELKGERLAQMRQLRREHRELEAEKGVELAGMRDEMAELLAVEQPDPEAVRELHANMAEIEGRLLAERVRLRNDMLELLDDDQRQELRRQLGPRR